MADRVEAVREIAIDKRGVTPRLTKTGYLQASGRGRPAGRVPEGLEAELDRGLPLPGDVRVHEAHVVGAARARPAARVSAQLAEGRPALRALEEPHAVRRPDHRVDDREGDGRARGAAARRGGDLQPAAATACRSGSTRRSGTGATSPGPSRSSSPTSRATTRTTRASASGCRRRRSRTPASRRCGPLRSPARVDYLYFVRKPDGVHHFFTASESEFCRKSLEYGYGGC